MSLSKLTNSLRSEDWSTLGDFFFTKNEGLAPLNRDHSSSLANVALELESNLLGSLCLLSENRLGLSTETLLLSIISPFSLGYEWCLTCLVLGHLVGSMLFAFLAVSSSDFGSMYLIALIKSLCKILPFCFLQYYMY